MVGGGGRKEKEKKKKTVKNIFYEFAVLRALQSGWKPIV